MVNPDAAEQITTVFSVVPFTQYNSTVRANDIALIRVRKETVLNVNIVRRFHTKFTTCISFETVNNRSVV